MHPSPTVWAAINTVIILAVLVGLSWVMYSPARQKSDRYQATVVPLANIMDVGFLAMTPLIVLLLGVDAPLFMLMLVLLAGAVGVVMAYNIRYYEPLIGKPDRLHLIAGMGRWALIAASLANIGYYVKLMVALVLVPFHVRDNVVITALAVGFLILIGSIGYFKGLAKLDRLGQKTTAFNLAAVSAVVFGFLAFNLQMLVTGQWYLPDYNPPDDPVRLRKLLGFFAIVQGFEASRYLRMRYPDATFRIKTMRRAQIVSGVAFVLLILASLILFAKVRPELKPVAIIIIGGAVTPILPYLILVTGITSQMSAAVNAVSSRSDLMLEATHDRIPRKYTYPLLVVPTIALVLVADIQLALSVASRIFAGFFALQCVIAIVLALRKRSWGRVIAFSAVYLAMLVIAIFGMSV